MEINYNGEWGTVCDDGWDYRDARVVCRQLGFGSSATAYNNAYFGQGSGSVSLDNVTCTGSESTLAKCGHLGVGNTRSCSHSEDAGVRCYPPGYNTYRNICGYNNVQYISYACVIIHYWTSILLKHIQFNNYKRADILMYVLHNLIHIWYIAM